MKVERNAPCPCGSGRKYKRCCGPPSSKAHKGSAPVVPQRAASCDFGCVSVCAQWCCGGATLLTIEEIKQCFDVFPITIGFRKYLPVSISHRAFLESIGMAWGEAIIVGDFIAGNRLNRRCRALDDDNFCKLHSEGRKPLQCRIVPFCALYPEELQDVVFNEQASGAFSRCEGYRASIRLNVWTAGRFTDNGLREAFVRFRQGMMRQRPVMARILGRLRHEKSFGDFLAGEGILETHIPPTELFTLLEKAGFTRDDCSLFLGVQSRLCAEDLAMSEKNSVFADYLDALRTLQGPGSPHQSSRT